MCTIKRIPTGKWRENCYIVHDENLDAVVIDPGEEFSTIRDVLETSRLSAKAILNTHAHYDHVGAISQLQEHFNIPFYLHSADSKLLAHANLYRMIFEGNRTIQIPKVDFDLAEKKAVSAGALSIEVIHTPGHTPGSVSLLIENNLFTGDTLLFGKAGRTDLPGGDKPALMRSIKKLLELPPEIVFHPGHGSEFRLADVSREVEAEVSGFLA